MKTVTISEELLRRVIWQLNEVRTGSDFECECWEVANELEAAVEGKPYKKETE